jgi:hypothetical protein
MLPVIAAFAKWNSALNANKIVIIMVEMKSTEATHQGGIERITVGLCTGQHSV